MKVYEMYLKNFMADENGETLWIATDRKLTIPNDSNITDLHEINPDFGHVTSGIDLIIK